MSKKPLEWLKQAEYDMGTAQDIFKTRRYIYTVFMCHLSIEKALKGLFLKEFNEPPPKIHSLVYFIEKMKLKPPDYLFDFAVSLNKESVPTRYPEDLERMQAYYSRKKTEVIVNQSRELLLWLKEQY